MIHIKCHVNHISSIMLCMVVSNTTCFFVSKSFKNLDFKKICNKKSIDLLFLV